MRRALLVVAALLLAGCGGVTGPDAVSSPRPSVTPAPVPTEDPTQYPPGLRERSVNATALSAAHERALRGSSYRYQFDRRIGRPEPGLGAVYVGPRVTVEATGPRRYSVVRQRLTERGGGLSVTTFQRARYADSDRVLFRTGNGTSRRPFRPNDTAYGARLAGDVVGQYLAVGTASVRAFDNGSALVRGNGSRAVEGVDYRVTAMVSSTGVVRRFDALYVRNGRVNFATYRLGSPPASVTPPPWANGSTETATAATSPTTAVNATATDLSRPRG
ncbi:hypothetical protein [Halorarius halobius]|uniref:hypothetical protein n=1 Tax=Halorarius halobius TaxID=2962671 RepID=UPI0020CD2A19|nr:hypothetical protein [Halorarius halobius]